MEIFKNIIEILELSKEEIESNNENITATLDLQDLKSLKNLYDLYQAEKEKNNTLLVELASNNYISKDKIREKIEEVDKEKLNYSESEYYLENEIKGYCIDKLEELLEE